MASDTPLEAANARERKNRIGSIGAGARSSHATNAASATTPVPSAPTTVPDVQPSVSPRTMPNTTPSRPTPASVSPGRSSRPAGP